MMKKKDLNQNHETDQGQSGKEQQGVPFTPLFDGKVPNFSFLSIDDQGNLTTDNIASDHPVDSSWTPQGGLFSMIDMLGSFAVEKCKQLRKEPEKLEMTKAYLDLAEMCLRIRNGIENWSSRNNERAIEDGLVHEFYGLLMGCFFLGNFNSLVSVEEYLPDQVMQLMLNKVDHIKQSQDKHAAQSSAEHQEQDKELADHDASVTAAHAAQDKQLAGVPAMVEREQIDSARELQKILAQAELMGLPPEELKLVGLWFSVGRVPEIALKMGVSRQAVYKRMRAIGSRYKVKGLPDPFVRLPSRREAERQRQEDASDRQVEQIIDDAWRSDK